MAHYASETLLFSFLKACILLQFPQKSMYLPYRLTIFACFAVLAIGIIIVYGSQNTIGLQFATFTTHK
jgi:hypothetical protein